MIRTIVAVVVGLTLLFNARVFTLVSIEGPSDMDKKKETRTTEDNVSPLLDPEGQLREGLNLSAPGRLIEGQDEFSHSIPAATGTLSIFAMLNPDPKNLLEEASPGNRYLDLDLEGDEWKALFFDTLGCPAAIDEPSFPNEDLAEWQRRYSLKFQQAIPNCRMLSRIWDLNIYIGYRPDEITQLRDECLKVKDSTSSGKALSGLSKLLSACEEASKFGYGLLLVPD